MAWTDLSEEVQELFADKSSDLILAFARWGAWKRARNVEYRKAQRKKTQFLIKCIRAKHRIPKPQPIGRSPELEARALRSAGRKTKNV